MIKKIIFGLVVAAGVFAVFEVYSLVQYGKYRYSATSFEDCVGEGFAIINSYPRQCKRPDGRIFVEQIVTSAPEVDFNLNTPKAGQKLMSPLNVEGEAKGGWYFEASFPVKLLDGNGKVLAQVPAQAQEEWMTDKMVPFKATLIFATPTTSGGTLIFSKDNPSGMPERDYSVRVDVRFMVATTSVKAYFGNTHLATDPNNCASSFPVIRIIPKTLAVVRAALESLLAGPSEEDKAAGFFTSLNPGVTIQKLTIENGVARVDLSKELDRAVGGSCRVTAISNQIEETLKQFSDVKQVIISIDGRTEDILQP